MSGNSLSDGVSAGIARSTANRRIALNLRLKAVAWVQTPSGLQAEIPCPKTICATAPIARQSALVLGWTGMGAFESNPEPVSGHREVSGGSLLVSRL